MIAGLDDNASAHFSGRALGPKFVWKQAGGKAASAKTTSASRAWRLSALWLTQVARAGGERKARLAACWKLFNYKHPAPEPAVASEEQKSAFKEFQMWRQVVASVTLDDHWVKVFTSMAMKQADEQERRAQKAQFHATMAWLQDGPSQGLRRQHQFTKVRGGWVQSAVVNGEPQGSEEGTVEDGLSPEQLRSVARPPDASMMQPASIQQETELQAANWHCA